VIGGPHLAATYRPLGWDPARETLYYVASGERLARYRAGAGRAVALPARLSGRFLDMAILG
jgi:hypothetical protein